jgi:hypothetical protein
MPRLLNTEGSADGRDELLYSGTVIDAFFTSNEYGESLGVRSRLDEADLLLNPWMESGEHTRYFKLGRIAAQRGEKRIAWTVLNDGAAVKGDTEDRMFRADSDIGRLVDHIAQLPGVNDLPDDFDPRVAASWKALGHVTWGLVPVTKQLPTGNKVTDKKGVERDEFKPTQTKMVLPLAIGGGVAVAEVEPVDIDSFGLTSDQIAALAKAAADNPTDDKAFLGAAFKIEGIMSNSPFVAVLTSNTAGVREALPF